MRTKLYPRLAIKRKPSGVVAVLWVMRPGQFLALDHYGTFQQAWEFGIPAALGDGYVPKCERFYAS